VPATASALLNTLLCFVFVARGSGQHSFCSVYDFGPWPLLQGYSAANLAPSVLRVRVRERDG